MVLTAIIALTATAAPQCDPGDDRVAAPLRIAVAANFRATLDAIAENFTQQTGIDISISSASTGVLSAQLRRGAPFDLLLAADRRRPDTLAADGFSLTGSHCYAQGSLVLLGATNAKEALSNDTLKLAIANPRFAPYGSAALQAITHARGKAPRPNALVLGTNVLQTLQFYRHGAADLALVSRSLSPDSGEAIPDEWHDPILQHAVISRHSAQPENARRFLKHVLSDDVQGVLHSNGYTQCS